MNKNNFRKKLCCSIVAVLSLFALYGNKLHAADITYHPGMAITAGTLTPVTETVANGQVTLTNMGMAIPSYILIGWHTRAMPFITLQTVETAVMAQPTFYSIGDPIDVQADITLYAVWAVDRNNDGYPDYGGSVVTPKLTKEIYDRLMSALYDRMYAEDEGISLRSLPGWDIDYDLPAINDSVYYVGCWYNTDTARQLTEPIITFNKNAFGNITRTRITANTDLELVFEYGGVLLDTCMVGGKAGKRLSRIPFPAGGTTVDELFQHYPFMFSEIEKDGQGILKMYFYNPATDTVAVAGDLLISGFPPDEWRTPGSDPWTGGYPQPFWNAGTGFSDTLTIKFNIYNKPEFKSGIISQRVDTAGYIDLKHLSGTPLKYMMRCINGFRWRPADSPLTNAERNEIWNEGANICLREMDKTIGYQAYQVQYYKSPDLFLISNHVTEFNDFMVEYLYPYNDSIYNTVLTPAEQLLVDGEYAFYTGFMGLGHDDALNAALMMCELMYAIPYSNVTAYAVATARATANWVPVYGARMAAKIYIPDPCRETFCLNFESKPQPGIQREVFIPQVDGVTTNPEYGAYYIPSQDDFNFTAKYAAAQPMKVTTNRIINGVEEVLPGTLNEKGEYEYVIHKVTQNIQLTFSPGSVDNASIDGIAVWSYNNTINIRVAKEDVASIYSIAGQMVKRVELSDGDNPIPMERGVYIVTLKDGAVHKVTVK